MLLAAFAWHALRTPDEPIIDLRLFRHRALRRFSGVVFFFSMAMLGTALLLPLYYQQVRGEDALHAGLLLAPQGLGMAIALFVAGRLTDRSTPGRSSSPGCAHGRVHARLHPARRAHDRRAAQRGAFVSGLGIGAALVPAMAGVYKHLPTQAVARATSAIRIFQQLGGSFGIAILAVVLQQHAAGAITTAGLGGRLRRHLLVGAGHHRYSPCCRRSCCPADAATPLCPSPRPRPDRHTGPRRDPEPTRRFSQ